MKIAKEALIVAAVWCTPFTGIGIWALTISEFGGAAFAFALAVSGPFSMVWVSAALGDCSPQVGDGTPQAAKGHQGESGEEREG